MLKNVDSVDYDDDIINNSIKNQPQKNNNYLVCTFSNNEFICSLNLLKLIVDELILCHFAKLLTINIQMHKSNYQSIDKIIIEFNK